MYIDTCHLSGHVCFEKPSISWSYGNDRCYNSCTPCSHGNDRCYEAYGIRIELCSDMCIDILTHIFRCFQCERPDPRWASLNNGVVLCLDCAAWHRGADHPRSVAWPKRGLGVHISFMRSLDMDSWDDAQTRTMEHAGNSAVRGMWQSLGLWPPSKQASWEAAGAVRALVETAALRRVDLTTLPLQRTSRDVRSDVRSKFRHQAIERAWP